VPRFGKIPNSCHHVSSNVQTLEESTMNDDDLINPAESDDTKGRDEADTPTQPLTEEQKLEEQRRKVAEIERKVADGN
jgi:hypothetical protein